MQARLWIGTIPECDFGTYQIIVGFPLPVFADLQWYRGQLEIGEGGFRHWQVVVQGKKPLRVAALKRLFGERAHWEKTRSESAGTYQIIVDEYVWKEETRVEGTQFEVGTKAVRRNVSKDWDQIYSDARSGNLDNIPRDILVRCYSQINKITQDNLQPNSVIRSVHAFWGRTGTGKTRRAWEEAGLDAYPKDPSTKWWDGYRGQEHVVIDEFRGKIAIEHMLRWLDRYPVIVERKGGSTVLRASSIWITSNLAPELWYVGMDEETVNALVRRLNIIQFS